MNPILNSAFNKEEFSPSNWRIRRKTMFIALIFCSIIYAINNIFIMFAIWNKSPGLVDPTLVSVISGVQSSIVILSGTIIGTYVFGAAYDTNSYRNSITSLVKDTKSSIQSPDVEADIAKG